MENFEIILYEKPDGSCPVTDFLSETDEKLRARLIKTIELLEAKGPAVREPQSKPLQNGIFEIRADVGRNAARILYFFVVGKKIVLTNGFIKKTQKTPKNELELAVKYREEYLSRQ